MIEITTLADEQKVFLVDARMYHLAICVIVAEIKTGISHNYCICKAVPAELVESFTFKGLQEILEKDTVIHLAEKKVTVRTRCLISHNRERLLRYAKNWFTVMSSNDDIDYKWG